MRNFLSSTQLYLWLGNIGIEFVLIFALKRLRLLQAYEIFICTTDSVSLLLALTCSLRPYALFWAVLQMLRAIYLSFLSGAVFSKLVPRLKHTFAPVVPGCLILVWIISFQLPWRLFGENPPDIKEFWLLSELSFFICFIVLTLGWLLQTILKKEKFLVLGMVVFGLMSLTALVGTKFYEYLMTGWFLGSLGLLFLLFKERGASPVES